VQLTVPLLSQLATGNSNRFNQCGETCVKMVAEFLTMPAASESIYQIEGDEMGDPNAVGYSTTTQAVEWFVNRGVPAIQVQPQDVAASISAALTQGYPTIYLSYWDLAARTGGHFRVAVGDDGANITFNNPWTGGVDVWPYADVNNNSLGHWLVIVQQAKAATVDTTLQAAAVARYSALGIQANVNGALFKAYARQIKVWMAYGQDNLLDPTPAILPETVPDSATRDAYDMLDSGIIRHWKASDGMVYQAEDKERQAIMAACGWVGKAA